MKFARYLEDTRTPEWKRAYIDYRLLKKKISAIRAARENFIAEADSPSASHPSLLTSLVPHHDNATVSQPSLELPSPISETSHAHFHSAPLPRPSTHSQRSLYARTISTFSPRSLIRRQSTSNTAQLRRVSPLPAAYPPSGPIPLRELELHLNHEERAFFETLDDQLDKVEAFYINREDEMRKRSEQLREQLAELSEHRAAYDAAHVQGELGWSTALADSVKIKVPSLALYKDHDAIPDAAMLREELSQMKGKAKGDLGSNKPRPVKISTPPAARNDHKHNFDPEDYGRAQKKLKKAMLEHYRGLEMLQNYRVRAFIINIRDTTVISIQILNVTGFRKALKKFEKVTRIPAQHSYMSEKVDPSALGSGDSVKAMLTEAESLFAEKFEYGSKKKALNRLRQDAPFKSHHFSTFQSGVTLGLAIPALISGIYESFQPNTRAAIPAWGALLYVYATFFIPVLFILLVGINLLVWARFRINYVFIFELDVRTRLDHREYFQLPAFLMFTLCYAFWLSFARIGYPSVSPTTWPLLWLILAAALVFDPLPTMHKSSRYWTLRGIGKQLLSGTRRVEFTDFWIGDQFCSLSFSLANLYFIGCVYERRLDSQWSSQCGSASRHWPAALFLAILPFIVRLVQCIRRYADSKLFTHLINGGKYASGILAVSLYYSWRHFGSGRGALFICWCLANTMYSLYAGAWDFLMDWSVLQPHAKHRFLRAEIVYSDYQLVYYISIVANTLLRFLWVLYIPVAGPNMFLRSFIVGMLEMLRRVQWNFYRVEAEFIGHMDQFRITRDVPLPYSFDESQDQYGDDNLTKDESLLKRSWLQLRQLWNKDGK